MFATENTQDTEQERSRRLTQMNADQNYFLRRRIKRMDVARSESVVGSGTGAPMVAAKVERVWASAALMGKISPE